MKEESRGLEKITEDQAKMFVEEGMAKFGVNPRVLIFKKTENVYYRHHETDYFVFVGTKEMENDKLKR